MSNTVEKTEEQIITEQRVSFIRKVLEIEQERAFVLNRFIADIPYGEISAFFRYRVAFNEEHASKEMVTLKAYKSYTREKTVSKIRKGSFVFMDFDEMVDFVQTYFVGEDLTKGAQGFKGNVIIRVGTNKRLFDSTDLSENGFARQLDQEKEIGVYEWLFLNQKKIGYAPMLSDERKKKLEALLEKKLKEESGLSVKGGEDREESEVRMLEERENSDEVEEELPPVDISNIFIQ